MKKYLASLIGSLSIVAVGLLVHCSGSASQAGVQDEAKQESAAPATLELPQEAEEYSVTELPAEAAARKFAYVGPKGTFFLGRQSKAVLRDHTGRFFASGLKFVSGNANVRIYEYEGMNPRTFFRIVVPPTNQPTVVGIRYQNPSGRWGTWDTVLGGTPHGNMQ